MIKILVRKNLKMSPGKLAAQAVHAALMLPPIHPCESIVVLTVTDRVFRQAKAKLGAVVVTDAWLTEVPPHTETALAFSET